MDKPTATIEQITGVIDPVINLMATHLFTKRHTTYLSAILKSLHILTIEGFAENKDEQLDNI